MDLQLATPITQTAQKPRQIFLPDDNNFPYGWRQVAKKWPDERIAYRKKPKKRPKQGLADVKKPKKKLPNSWLASVSCKPNVPKERRLNKVPI